MPCHAKTHTYTHVVVAIAKEYNVVTPILGVNTVITAACQDQVAGSRWRWYVCRFWVAQLVSALFVGTSKNRYEHVRVQGAAQ